jgi:hypothetical protein
MLSFLMLSQMFKILPLHPASTLTFKETIYLNAKVLLNFSAIDERYVTVSVLNKTVSLPFSEIATKPFQPCLPALHLYATPQQSNTVTRFSQTHLTTGSKIH